VKSVGAYARMHDLDPSENETARQDARALHTSIRGLPKHWRRRPGRSRHTCLRTQTFSRSIMAWTQHGDTPRTEDAGSSSWKRLRFSQGHARDDDDDDDDENEIRCITL